MTGQELKAAMTLEYDLRQFTGTDQWYRHSLCRKILYTDGVKYLADVAGAHWLVDKIATNQMRSKIKAEEFQVWKLKVDDSKGVLTCEDGNGGRLHREKLTFTDFPLAEIDLWVEGNVILLPSEH